MDAIATVNRRPGKLWAFLQFPLTRFLLGFLALGIWVAASTVALGLVLMAAGAIGFVVTSVMGIRGEAATSRRGR